MAASAQTLFKAGIDGEIYDRHMVGDLQVIPIRITLSGSYATGGDTLDFRPLLQNLGKGAVLVVILPDTIKGYELDYDYANRKLIVRQGDNTNAAAAPAIELPAAAYPGALTGAELRGILIGR